MAATGSTATTTTATADAAAAARAAATRTRTKIVTINLPLAKKLTPPRKASSKKGDNGTVLVAGGSRYYHGAPVFTSMAALRSGTDLVYTAVPRSITTEVRSFSPALIVLPLPDDKLTVGAANRLVGMMPKKPDVAAIGMGMSIATSEAMIALVSKLKGQGTKLVLDASALIPEILPIIEGTDTIVTPHAGEYRRLTGSDPGRADSTKERIANVRTAASRHGITILLKGPVDVVADGSGRAGINRTHNCAMTVGGTGDVLAGVTAGLLCKIGSFEAALLAAYFNGLAGNLSFNRVGLHMTSTDLLEDLPQAMKRFDSIIK
ncbi:NAD(P)H-hydrate dehydratase [Nitrososphaera sp.]|uniref:NAD(P)H-hydrate dehydratase n=1 Tax=Nitrososphaera sp. TaxID=1971748 RepID=UPI00307D06DF